MRLGIVALLISIGMGAGLALGAEPESGPESGYDPGPATNDLEPLSLLPIPKIKLAQPVEADDAEAKEIRQHIKDLAQIDEMHDDVSRRGV